MKLKGPIERVRGTWEHRLGGMASVTSGPSAEFEVFCFLDSWDETDWPSTELWILRMVSKLSKREHEPGYETLDVLDLIVWGLLLVPTGRAEDEFLRVGVAKLNFDPLPTGRVATITIV